MCRNPFIFKIRLRNSFQIHSRRCSLLFVPNFRHRRYVESPQQQKKGRRQRGFDEYSEFVYGQFQIYPFKHVLITFRSPKIPPA